MIALTTFSVYNRLCVVDLHMDVYKQAQFDGIISIFYMYFVY